MAFMKYQPTPIFIPETSELSRVFVADESTTDSLPLSAADYREYDSKTVFYDVFRCDRDRKVIAIGPPPVNLQEEISYLKVTWGRRHLSHTRRQYLNLCVIEIVLGDELVRGADLILRLCFLSFEVIVRVPPSAVVQSASASGIALLTLQKNNPIVWITDWCRWHHRLHGVTCIVLYDNGSSNSRELERALTDISKDLDVILVTWSFPYGPGRSSKNRFLGTGSRNHYRLLFGPLHSWCLSMDVDEYLVVRGASTLRQYLSGCDRKAVSGVVFDLFFVPPYVGQPEMSNRRAGLHSFRNRSPRGKYLKYIFKPAEIEYNRTHVVYPRKRLFEILRPFPRFYNRVLQLFYGSFLKRWTRNRWLRSIYHRHASLRYPGVDRIFFYHFRGLNTNWKPEGNLGERVQSFDPERHIEDPLIRELATRAGLLDGR